MTLHTYIIDSVGMNGGRWDKIDYLNILKNNFWLINWVYRDLEFFNKIMIPNTQYT